MNKGSKEFPWGYIENEDWRKEPEFIPILSVKLRKIRKQIGLNQRDFAKLIGWNINKYSLMEQGKIDKLGCQTPEEAFPIRFILRLAETIGANPYWLTNDSVESIYDIDPDKTARNASEAVSQGMNDYAMFAEPMVIEEFKRYRLRWEDDE